LSTPHQRPGEYAKEEQDMNAVTPSLTFKDHAEDAIKLYVSVIKNSKIGHIMRSEGDTSPIPSGSVLNASFELDGREFTAMDGGPSFSFSEGFSMVATCDTQEELDNIWTRLSSDGGEEGRCGWLKDRFGVSWQVIPRALGEMMEHPHAGNPGKVMEALLKMDKIDIATLKKAYQQE
jgi:predicted 3-demethylubiquinone-9 3-methyltransferase (glyoxalase superfamily)